MYIYIYIQIYNKLTTGKIKDMKRKGNEAIRFKEPDNFKSLQNTFLFATKKYLKKGIDYRIDIGFGS